MAICLAQGCTFQDQELNSRVSAGPNKIPASTAYAMPRQVFSGTRRPEDPPAESKSAFSCARDVAETFTELVLSNQGIVGHGTSIAFAAQIAEVCKKCPDCAQVSQRRKAVEARNSYHRVRRHRVRKLRLHPVHFSLQTARESAQMGAQHERLAAMPDLRYAHCGRCRATLVRCRSSPVGVRQVDPRVCRCHEQHECMVVVPPQ